MNVAEFNKVVTTASLLLLLSSVSAQSCSNSYIVVPGDTLSAISDRFGVSVNEILQVNPSITNPNEIFVGQTIDIPPCSVVGGGGGSGGGGSSGTLSRENFIQCGGFVDTYNALQSAMSQMGVSFSSGEEAAMFMAQIRHEGTTNPTKTKEFCSSQNPPCGGAYNGPCPWDSSVSPAPGQHYYGRGPIQLTWVCNYNAAGSALGLNLVNNPEQIVQNNEVAWKTALWYWFQRGPHAAAKALDFAGTTRAINGALECGSPGKQEQRVQYYREISGCMGVGVSASLYC
eukprot:TRINITY_DN17810_c0_g1_i4.p1 TRINITY_DN17810_c0_g1~~TRINITY_DN17810_c0_g1_i4.p1  ORF type:complete len:320 (+),score=49.43 TRINITY_DN17810_c0_g1_i4:103-960(+)